MAPEINVEANFEGNSRIWKEICFYELIKIIPGVDNFQTMVISRRNFLPPETKYNIFEFLVNKPYSTCRK